MTPKEKAEELMMKYIIKLNYKLPLKDFGCIAEECALIAVNEIQEVLMTDELYNPGKLSFDRIDDYWEEVKQELNNIK